jgi:hypothetical protein
MRETFSTTAPLKKNIAGFPVRRLPSPTAEEFSGMTVRSAPNHRVPRSRLCAAPPARYMAEKRVAAMRAKMRIIAILRYGRLFRLREINRKKLNRGDERMLFSLSLK